MKKKVDIARAWKDEAYRLSLGSDELALVPSNPAGMVELSDVELDMVIGGADGGFSPDGISIGATSCCQISVGSSACCSEQQQ